jgi:hypothetical protein
MNRSILAQLEQLRGLSTNCAWLSRSFRRPDAEDEQILVAPEGTLADPGVAEGDISDRRDNDVG